MGRPTLSVIMPNYNHGHFLPEALDAILSQSWPADEVLIVDDASTDDSVEVIEGFARKHASVRLLRNERNMGAVYSGRRVFDAATGDYLYPSAADDRVQPGFFAKSMELLAQHPQAGLCCSDPAYFGDVVR